MLSHRIWTILFLSAAGTCFYYADKAYVSGLYKESTENKLKTITDSLISHAEINRKQPESIAQIHLLKNEKDFYEYLISPSYHEFISDFTDNTLLYLGDTSQWSWQSDLIDLHNVAISHKDDLLQKYYKAKSYDYIINYKLMQSRSNSGMWCDKYTLIQDYKGFVHLSSSYHATPTKYHEVYINKRKLKQRGADTIHLAISDSLPWNSRFVYYDFNRNELVTELDSGFIFYP